MFFASDFEIRVDFLKLRFCLVDFEVRIWLVYAFDRFTLPLFVSLNRLAAPLHVFNFGIYFISPYAISFSERASLQYCGLQVEVRVQLFLDLRYLLPLC